MKIAATAAGLADMLALAELALDAKSNIAILGTVHIQAGADGATRFTANAMDRAVVLTAKTEVKEPGETVIRASALAGLARGFPKDSPIMIDTDTQGAQVICGRSRYELGVMPIDQLPPVPAIDEVAGEIELGRKELLEGIKQVEFAASTEETRYYLNGILLHDASDRLSLVATDGHRLAKCSIVSAPFAPDHTCIVPNASVLAVTKLLTKTATEKVKLRRSKSLLEVIAAGFTFVSRLIEGTFPDYARLIPAAPKNSVVVNRTELVGALARLSAVAEHNKRMAALVGLAWGPADPTLHLSLPHQPDAADDVITAAIIGGAPIQTAAQVRHIAELVDQLHGKDVCIASDGNSNPILFTDTASDSMLVVQMPCRVSPRQSKAA